MASHILQKVANVVVYLFFLSATVYSLVGPSPAGDAIPEGQTYITPCKLTINNTTTFLC